MATATLPQSYLRNTVLTASPEQLHLMLLDGVIRFAMQARDALVLKKHEEFCEKLSRCLAIVSELKAGLRPEVQPELCDRMMAIYNFLYRTLVRASTEKNPARIDDVLRVLSVQRETWALIVEKTTAAAHGNESPSEPIPFFETIPGSSEMATAGSLNLEG